MDPGDQRSFKTKSLWSLGDLGPLCRPCSERGVAPMAIPLGATRCPGGVQHPLGPGVRRGPKAVWTGLLYWKTVRSLPRCGAGRAQAAPHRIATAGQPRSLRVNTQATAGVSRRPPGRSSPGCPPGHPREGRTAGPGPSVDPALRGSWSATVTPVARLTLHLPGAAARYSLMPARKFPTRTPRLKEKSRRRHPGLDGCLCRVQLDVSCAAFGDTAHPKPERGNHRQLVTGGASRPRRRRGTLYEPCPLFG